MHKIQNVVDSEVCGSIRGNKQAMDALARGDYNGKSALSLSAKYEKLFPIEEYLQGGVKDRLQREGIDLSYDVTAIEPLRFETINYTTYAGTLILHPLNFELSMRQMYEAHSDGFGRVKGYYQHFRNTIKTTSSFSKYSFSDAKKVQAKEALVVLAGANKIKKHCCAGKMRMVLERFGRENVLFKKHPVSHDDVYDELNDFLGGIHFADAHADLFQLMRGSNYILSSFISESALVAKVLGKNVDHMDLWQNRDTTSFGHINYFLFSVADPLHWLDQAFASPKSGVICPDVDKDWKQKIDAYIDYIVGVRNIFEQGYVL